MSQGAEIMKGSERAKEQDVLPGTGWKKYQVFQEY